MSEPNKNQRRVPRLSQKPLQETPAPRAIPANPAQRVDEQPAQTAPAPQTAAAPKKKSGGAAAIVFRVSAAVFFVSLLVLGFIGFNYWQGQSKYENVSKDYFPVQDVSVLSLDEIHLNWDALRAANSETVAWVYIPGTGVNYPVVHTTDNDKYIKTDYQGETNWAVSYGAIFLDCKDEADMSCQNNFIYGHNMNNGAMFHILAELDKDDNFNKYRTVYLFTPNGNYRLTSFALLHVGGYDDLVQVNPGSAEDQEAYLREQVNRSVIVSNENMPEISDIDKTFVLMTCDNLATDGRYALYCYVADSNVEGVNKLEKSSLVGINDVQAIDANAASAAAGESTDPEEAY